MRILIVEDEPRMLELLRKGLYECGYTVMTAADGETGLEIAKAYQFDSMVLDIGLPRMNGYELIRELRAHGCKMPVLMLTARDAEDDIIRGLDLGADDYLTKPFSFPELVARLQSIARPVRGSTDGRIEAGDLLFDPVQHVVKRNGESIDLTRQEFLLLACLMQKMNQCVPRQILIESIWGPDHAIGSSTLDVLVNSLRTKIDQPSRKKRIVTVRGSGYLFSLGAVGIEEA